MTPQISSWLRRDELEESQDTACQAGHAVVLPALALTLDLILRFPSERFEPPPDPDSAHAPRGTCGSGETRATASHIANAPPSTATDRPMSSTVAACPATSG